MQQHEFPTLRLLLEDEGEDIVFGLRRALDLIKTGWSSDYSAVKREHEKIWKKLSPAQQQKLKTLFQVILEKLFRTPNSTVNTDLISASDKLEAQAIVATFNKFSTGIRDIDLNFLDNQEYGGVITSDDRDTFGRHYQSSGGPADIRLGPTTVKFLTDHASQINKIIGVYDVTLGFNIGEVVNRLNAAVAATEKDKQKEAVQGLHYFMLDLAHEFDRAKDILTKKFSGKTGESPKPPADDSTKPVTKP